MRRTGAGEFCLRHMTIMTIRTAGFAALQNLSCAESRQRLYEPTEPSKFGDILGRKSNANGKLQIH